MTDQHWQRYPARYHDERGTEETLLYNDGKTLRMELRGVTFTGTMLDDFTPALPDGDPALEAFTLNRYLRKGRDLCGYTLEFEMQVPVASSVRVGAGVLEIRIELGHPTQRGGLDHEEIRLALRHGGQTYASSGCSGWFEDELLEVQRSLPSGVYMRTCFNCAFSDYSVYGHGAFGKMLCFRNQKRAYLKAGTKDEYMDVMDSCEDLVQETYLCPDFRLRAPNTGYRG